MKWLDGLPILSNYVPANLRALCLRTFFLFLFFTKIGLFSRAVLKHSLETLFRIINALLALSGEENIKVALAELDE